MTVRLSLHQLENISKILFLHQNFACLVEKYLNLLLKTFQLLTLSFLNVADLSYLYQCLHIEIFTSHI